MNEQEIKVLVTDLDGTLLAEDRDDISQKLQIFLKKWVASGGYWVVASGRPEDSLKDCFRFWDVRPTAFIAQNRYIFYQDRDEFTAEVLYIPDPSWNRYMRRDEQLLAEDKPKIFEKLARWAAGRYAVEEITDDWIKFYTVEGARSAGEQLDEITGEKTQVLRNGCYLGLMPGRAGKGPALERLFGRQLKATAEEVLCVGDSDNDRDMLDGSYGFHSAAPGSAEPEIKAAVRDNGGTIIQSDLDVGLNLILETKGKEGKKR